MNPPAGENVIPFEIDDVGDGSFALYMQACLECCGALRLGWKKRAKENSSFTKRRPRHRGYRKWGV